MSAAHLLRAAAMLVQAAVDEAASTGDAELARQVGIPQRLLVLLARPSTEDVTVRVSVSDGLVELDRLRLDESRGSHG